MAVYDGFFDAMLDEDTQEYDRAYNSGDFTTYFDKIVGSGVCVHNDPDSFKVRFADGAAIVSPGYLFIRGYWLRNDADYSIPLTGTSTLAIAARLNLGKRMIELEAVSPAQSYQDALVLALVNPSAGTAEDTRYNTDICGVIDTAGELSKKVAWAVNYIDNEIETRLAQMEQAVREQTEQMEQDFMAQSAKLDAKLDEAQQQIDRMAPLPVGTIRFSAAEDMGEEWLPCNGDFISQEQYPELVSVLGELTPSADKFQLISDGEIGPQISNGVVYNGRMWVYSYSTKKLYGVDVNGNLPVKEIEVTSKSAYFRALVTPSGAYPIALSIVPNKIGNGANLFLAQVVQEGSRFIYPNTSFNLADYVLIFTSEFSDDADSIEVSQCATTIINSSSSDIRISIKNNCIPYVISKGESSGQYYYCAIAGYDGINFVHGLYLRWSGTSNPNVIPFGEYSTKVEAPTGFWATQRVAFSTKNKGEAIFIDSSSNNGYKSVVTSVPNGIFSRDNITDNTKGVRTVSGPITIAGRNYILSGFNVSAFPATPITELTATKIGMSDLSLPSAARTFTDAAAYLWGKDIYMIFVGTGIIFSRTLETGSFGYLDTTDVLGTITQFGYLDYSQDENTLYLLGQDTSNRVKVAKMELNTLYDYATDGAWLPHMSMDKIPAYIKAKEG